MGFNEPIDWFEHRALLIEYAALSTAITELRGDTQGIFVRAAELTELAHRGECIQSGNRILTKDEYYRPFREAEARRQAEVVALRPYWRP